ncbi:MAG TPA: hypothetical protein VK929_09565 [Longimicrobiales bacterium]|nr:hypothetical protein [Longimicrobiales bacterium]
MTKAPQHLNSMRRMLLAGSCTTALMLHAPAMAQDLNFLFPVSEIQERLTVRPFTVADWRGSRADGDRTSRVTLSYDDGSVMLAKFAPAPPNGGVFNNEPRYEVAAYVVQTLFLDEDEYVVPPTVMRAFPLEFVLAHMPGERPTFREAPGSVLVALSYWLIGVTPENFWDPERARSDSVYARHVANFNILTHVIRHTDANVGNFLISEHHERPRVYSVDNGVAFRSRESNRGTMWRDLQVERLPRGTVERLRQITYEGLTAALGVLVEFEVRDGTLVQVSPGPNMSRGRGVRRSAERIQLGLTDGEIRDVEQRIRNLVRDVDRGRLQLF